MQPIKDDTGPRSEPRINGGSTAEPAGRNNFNGTINPRKTVQILDNSRGDPVEILGKEKVCNVNVDVLEDTMRENQ